MYNCGKVQETNFLYNNISFERKYIFIIFLFYPELIERGGYMVYIHGQIYFYFNNFHNSPCYSVYLIHLIYKFISVRFYIIYKSEHHIQIL